MSKKQPNRAHLCLIQPAGYVHSLGLLDPLQHVRRGLESLGVAVSVGKNRLEAGAVNYVFGAHLGFDASWAQEFICVFVNLEQLGDGGAHVSPSYLRLLRENHAVDYHASNVRHYSSHPSSVPLICFGFSPAALAVPTVPLEERPLDLLFFGSLTPDRIRVIERIQSAGVAVAVPDAPLYGPERDDLIRHAKAVLNITAYPSARFEQVRASFVLSLGTPLVSDRRALVDGDRAYENLVDWFDPDGLEAYFTERFVSPEFFEDARTSLKAFTQHTGERALEAMWDRHRALDVRASHAPHRFEQAQVSIGDRPGSYRPGWLNISDDLRAHPDLLVEDYASLMSSVSSTTRRWGEVALEPGCAALVKLGRLGQGESDTAARLELALYLLESGGRAIVEWPRDRALDELEEWTDTFWLSGRFDHRFAVSRTDAVDFSGKACGAERADRWRFVLTKTPVSMYEMTVARSAMEDLEVLMG